MKNPKWKDEIAKHIGRRISYNDCHYWVVGVWPKARTKVLQLRDFTGCLRKATMDVLWNAEALHDDGTPTGVTLGGLAAPRVLNGD